MPLRDVIGEDLSDDGAEGEAVLKGAIAAVECPARYLGRKAVSTCCSARRETRVMVWRRKRRVVSAGPALESGVVITAQTAAVTYIDRARAALDILARPEHAVVYLVRVDGPLKIVSRAVGHGGSVK